MSAIDDMGDQLARDVIAAMAETGDDRLHEKISKVLLDASPTMQEAFLTAYRVRVAEQRARKFLDDKVQAARAAKAQPQ